MFLVMWLYPLVISGFDLIEFIARGIVLVPVALFFALGAKNFVWRITKRSIAKSVKTIGDYAFAYTTNLETMGLGTGVTTLESYVFDLSSLHNIEIPKSLTKIGKNCFTNENSDINYGFRKFYVIDNCDIVLGNSELNAGKRRIFGGFASFGDEVQLFIIEAYANLCFAAYIGSCCVFFVRLYSYHR